MKTIFLTILTLVAFAGNSILCRLALGGELIDAASYTWIRLVAGIIALLLILNLSQKGQSKTKGNAWAAFTLFLYAVTLSYAYISLDTGIGALILFGAVQITMILVGVFSGNKLHAFEYLGVALAFIGLVYLLMPGASAPSLMGFLLMAISGVAWGVYSLLGKGSINPLQDTTYNFVRTWPYLLVLSIISIPFMELSYKGVWLAVLSGSVTSGIGYTIWYIALRGLTSVQAAVVQLLVPILASLGGVIFANEALSLRLILSSAMVLGGILAVILAKQYFKTN